METELGQQHLPVLLQEVITALVIDPDGFYIDGTFGRGGHSQAILSTLSPNGRLLMVDRDPEAISLAQQRFASDPRCQIQQAPFGRLHEVVKTLGWQGQVAGLLLDLGVSSPQLDTATRGFSFLHNGPLDMRMDTTAGMTAAEWLNTVPLAELITALQNYGEERYARRIAQAIVRERTREPIQTTAQLAAIVSAANPAWEKHKHPATRSFQAIRIAVNDELNELTSVLQHSVDLLKVGGRLAVISFHSLEDRLVKRFVRQHSRPDPALIRVPLAAAELPVRLRIIGRAIKPSAMEVSNNPRARSAVLRIAEKLL